MNVQRALKTVGPAMNKIHSDTETRLLREIQKDASLSLAELSERCGMAQSTVWRKLQEFENSGLIRARVALLDPQHACCGQMVIASVTLKDHAADTRNEFARLVGDRAEIVECQALSGADDYQLKIRIANVADYNVFLETHLQACPAIRDIRSAFVLSELKSTTELPI